MNILFISEVLPIDTYASQVVFYRHLVRLAEEGHTIHILTDRNSFINRKKDLPSSFILHLLPNRKWYYPPYRAHGLSQAFRFEDYYLTEVRPLIRKHQVELIVGFIYGKFLAPFAAFLQKRTGLPLVSFFHDDTVELNFFRNNQDFRMNARKILEASETVFIASEGFADNWKEFRTKFRLLYPIPSFESYVERKQAGPVCLGYSGSVYNEVIEPLEYVSRFSASAGLQFRIIGNNPKVNYLNHLYPSTQCLPLFDTAELANSFLVQHCNLCIIPYPADTESMPWIKTCFPSKLIQYCQIGMPTLVIAPADSALGKWCRKNDWILYMDRYDDERILNLVSLHSSEPVMKQVTYFRDNVFHPDLIHQQFKTSLVREN